MQQVQAAPECFLAAGAVESGQHSDRVEMVRLQGGLREGVAVQWAGSGGERRWPVGVTVYRADREVGPAWDFSLGRNFNSSYHFQPRSVSVVRQLRQRTALLEAGVD